MRCFGVGNGTAVVLTSMPVTVVVFVACAAEIVRFRLNYNRIGMIDTGNRCGTVAVIFSCRVCVIHRHNHFGRGIVCLVGNNNCLCTLRRTQCKLIVFIKCNFCAVYCHAVNICFVNGYRLFFTVSLAVFNTGNDRSSRIKHHSVGA